MTHSNNQNSVVPFDFQGNQIRIVQDNDGEIWFFGSDIAKVLGYTNPSEAIAYNVDEEDRQILSMLNIDSIYLTSTGGRSPTMINESGLYSLILRSQKEESKSFKRWVTKEVLPSIRKTGGYSIQTSDDPISANISMIRAIADSLEAFQERQTALENEHHALEERVNRIDNKNRMYTVVAYARLYQKNITSGQASVIGKRASKLSRQSGIECGQVYDARWGYVNTYREDILEQVWDG